MLCFWIYVIRHYWSSCSPSRAAITGAMIFQNTRFMLIGALSTHVLAKFHASARYISSHKRHAYRQAYWLCGFSLPFVWVTLFVVKASKREFILEYITAVPYNFSHMVCTYSNSDAAMQHVPDSPFPRLLSLASKMSHFSCFTFSLSIQSTCKGTSSNIVGMKSHTSGL